LSVGRKRPERRSKVGGGFHHALSLFHIFLSHHAIHSPELQLKFCNDDLPGVLQ